MVACGDDDGGPSGDANESGSAGTSPGKGGSSGSGTSGGAATAGTSGASSGGQGTTAGAGGTGGHAGTGTGTGTGGMGGEPGGASGQGGGGDAGQAGAAGTGGDGGMGGFDRWTACPTADAFEDDPSWPDTLEVTEGAVYCATFNESRTLKEELAKKALLRVTPGSYRLPAADREGLSLPLCISFGEDEPGVPAVPKSTSHQANAFAGNVTHRYTFVSEQPDPARRLTVGLSLSLPEGTAPGFVLDGDAPDPADPTEPQNLFTLCESLDQSCVLDRGFDSCTHESSTLHRHEITLDGGELTLDVRIGSSFAGTEPGAFVAARGTFRGVEFEQTNYFKLVYRPEHHHFVRDFAVLFDEAIDGACGVRILGFPADPNGAAPTAATVDCELDPIEDVKVDDFLLTLDP